MMDRLSRVSNARYARLLSLVDRGQTRRDQRFKAIRPPRPHEDRGAAIAKVLALWPHEIEDDSLAGRQWVLAKLRRALRAERRRGISGHWTYDLTRHVELLRVYRVELAAIAERCNANTMREGSATLRAARREP